MLQNQSEGYADVFKSHAKSACKAITSAQKSISRSFVPNTQVALRPAYADCANDRGDKVFSRIKTRMEDHIKDRRYSMFQDSLYQAQDSLLNLVTMQEKSLSAKIVKVFQTVRQDCTSVLIRGAVPEEAKLRESRQQLRKQVLELLNASEEVFRD